jgi:hypothetical protein
LHQCRRWSSFVSTLATGTVTTDFRPVTTDDDDDHDDDYDDGDGDESDDMKPATTHGSDELSMRELALNWEKNARMNKRTREQLIDRDDQTPDPFLRKSLVVVIHKYVAYATERMHLFFYIFLLFTFLNNNNNVIERSCVAVIVSKIVDKAPIAVLSFFGTKSHVSIHILLLFFLHLGSSTA